MSTNLNLELLHATVIIMIITTLTKKHLHEIVYRNQSLNEQMPSPCKLIQSVHEKNPISRFTPNLL